MKKLLILLSLCLLTACPQKKDSEEKNAAPEERAPQAELQQVSFAELEDWKNDNFSEMLPNLLNNCNRIAKIKTESIGTGAIKINTLSYQRICNRLETENFADDAQIRNFIESNFTPFAVTDNGNADGKFTSYYESTIKASFEKHDNYKYPVYGKPEDLIEINLKDFDATLPEKRLVGRIEKQKMIPYHDREAIETDGINAPVLMWADNSVDIHIMQIQGSAVAYMNDGQQVRVGFADSNGLPFRGIGSILLENGILPPENINMLAIKKWLNENPQEADYYMRQNRRYIFHKIISESGPVGAFGVPLQAGRSLAVDRSFIPLGSLLWLETYIPDGTPLNKLVIAQDIGSAIKGVVRGDYFWGSGGDEVLDMAGRMNSIGRYYILLPKEQDNALDNQ